MKDRYILFLFASAAALASTAFIPAVSAQIIDPYYAGDYQAFDLGGVPGLPPYYGGMAFRYDNPNKLLIGGNANEESGALYEVDVIRGADQHVTGFGDIRRYADAAWNDGGVVYGPNNVLFLARWPVNQIGQTKPGSNVTDKIIDMSQFGVGNNGESSVAALNFVPQGFGGAGRLKFTTWESGEWWDAGYSADGFGTYDITSPTRVQSSDLPGGPEGFVFVSHASPLFEISSMMVSCFSEGRVDTYELDALGNPILGSRRLFMSGIDGAEGAVFDPMTGDYLFSTFGAADRVVAVRGFDLPPPPVPEPSSIGLFGMGLLGAVGGWLQRRTGRRR
jgi:hypothetical protein